MRLFSKKMISIVLIVAMTIVNEGFMVLANSVSQVVADAEANEQEITNYYYEYEYEQKALYEQYETELEESNPLIEKEEDEVLLEEENEEPSDEILLDEDAETESIESESDETENEESESVETDAAEIESAESENTEIENAESESTETESAESDVATSSDAENEITETETAEIIENISTVSEVAEENDAIVSTVSEVVEENDIEISTESEVVENIDNEIATDSDAAYEDIATASEVNGIATDSEIENVSTVSEIGKQIVIATVSKVVWKVKKVFITTTSKINIDYKETEEKRLARLATYANVIITDNLGNEKLVRVPLKWKLDKTYDVHATSTKDTDSISPDVWRKKLGVEDYINNNAKEEVIATSNIVELENKIEEENKKVEDKKFVLVVVDEQTKNETKNEVVKETEKIVETEVETETETETETTIEIIDETVAEIAPVSEETIAGFTGTEATESEISDEENDDEANVDEAEEIETTEVDEVNDATLDVDNSEANDTEVNDSEVNDSEVNDAEETEIATPDEPEKVEDVAYEQGIENKNDEIINSLLKYYDLQSLYLYKIDGGALGDEIIKELEKLNATTDNENTEEDGAENIEYKNTLLDFFAKLFGINTAEEDDEVVENEDNEENANLSKLTLNQLTLSGFNSGYSEMYAAKMFGENATHTNHNISGDVVTIPTDQRKFVVSNYGDTSNMWNPVDGPAFQSLLTASGSNMFITGDYYLIKNYVIANPWIVAQESNPQGTDQTLRICLNGNNLTFATAGCIRGKGKVVITNCRDEQSHITTTGPQLNWHDMWYATTNETYTLYNQHALFAGSSVGIFGKTGKNNILFEKSQIKNRYIGNRARTKMSDLYSDEPEYSGDGSIVWGTTDVSIYGVSFEKNVAWHTNGVAVNCQLGALVLQDCKFKNNVNITNKGGAVAFNPKNAVIYDCTFEENKSAVSGGALYGKAYTSASNRGNMTAGEYGAEIQKTKFNKNYAVIHGGAVALDYLGENGVAFRGNDTDKVEFNDNVAGQTGGAIALSHVRSVDNPGSVEPYSYEDSNSVNRKMLIDGAIFKKNVAKPIYLDVQYDTHENVTNVFAKDAVEKAPGIATVAWCNFNNTNYGGAISANASVMNSVYATFPSDRPVKLIDIKNSKFNQNVAKGQRLVVDAAHETEHGEVTYYLNNYGGAIYLKEVDDVNIVSSEFDDNRSMTGANICAIKSKVNISGSEGKETIIKNGKDFNGFDASGNVVAGGAYAESELYKKLITSGGGAIYVMSDAKVKIDKDTKVESNQNAFYLDGGSIDIGAKKGFITANVGEYLIGYTNYEENVVKFSGTDIREHNFNVAKKDYSFTTHYSETVGGPVIENKHHELTKIQFENKNMITKNKRNLYEMQGTNFVSKRLNEYCNLEMKRATSNITLDLRDYLFDIPDDDFEERIGLYYDCFNPTEDTDALAYSNWNGTDVRVFNEGGLFTNYFDVDNNNVGGWARRENRPWRFYAENGTIRISPYTISVKFDSFIQNTIKIKPQFYNFKVNPGEIGLQLISTPTELIQGGETLQGKTLIGFLGQDQNQSSQEEKDKYRIWDFNTMKISNLSAGDDGNVLMIGVYTDDTIKYKACGTKNGEVCHHASGIQHADRGTGTSREENLYKNYVEVATVTQLAYTYNGKKTQYVLDRDLKVSAADLKNITEGGLILNLNGYKLIYDTNDGSIPFIDAADIENYPLDTTDDIGVAIVGKATTAETVRGIVTANGQNHKAAFIKSSGKSVIINNVDFENITAKDGSNEGLVYNGNANVTSAKNVTIENTTFKNVSFKSPLVAAEANVYLKDMNLDSNLDTGSLNLNGNNLVTLKAKGAVNSEFKTMNTTIKGYTFDTLVGGDYISRSASAKTTISISTGSKITQNTFAKSMVDLKESVYGNKSILEVMDAEITNNTVSNDGTANPQYLLSNDGDTTYLGRNGGDVKITENIIPDKASSSIIRLASTKTYIRGKVTIKNNKTSSGATSVNKTNAVHQVGDIAVKKVYFGDIALTVNANNTMYNWFVENPADNDVAKVTPVYTQEPNTKIIASASVLKIRYNHSDVRQLIYRNWGPYNVVGDNTAEELFARDDTYDSEPDAENFTTFKSGTSDTESDVYIGSGSVKVIFRFYENYVANQDEEKAGVTPTTNTQRVVPDVYTLLDAPKFSFDSSMTSVMWEGLYFPADSELGLAEDRSNECIYDYSLRYIPVKTTRSCIITGYVFNYGGVRHYHDEDGQILWMEARNEGHLQATTSYIYLHNDIEITKPLLHNPADTYYLCLNGHKLIFKNDETWMNIMNNCTLKIYDCKKTGSISSDIPITQDLIKMNPPSGNSKLIIGGEEAIVNIGPFTDVQNASFINVGQNVQSDIYNVVVDSVNAHSNSKSFMNMENARKASISNLTLSNNTFMSTSYEQAILRVIDGSNANDTNNVFDNIKIKKNKMLVEDGVAATETGYGLIIDGYEDAIFNNIEVVDNEVALGSPLRISGSGTLTMNNVNFDNNNKVVLNDVVDTPKNSANIDVRDFENFNINGGSFKKGGLDLSKVTNTSAYVANAVTTLYFTARNSSISNVTFDSNNSIQNQADMNDFSVAMLVNEDFDNITFNGCTFKNSVSKNNTYMEIAQLKGDMYFKDTTFTNMKGKNIIFDGSDNDAGNHKLVLDNVTVQNIETVDGGAFIVHGPSAYVVSQTELRVINSNISGIKGTGFILAGDKNYIYDTTVTGVNNYTSIDVLDGANIYLGDTVKIQGGKNNINLATNSIIKVESAHKLTMESVIYLTTPEIYNYKFLDNNWGKDYFEGYGTYNKNYSKNQKPYYIPEDIFKLDKEVADAHRVIFRYGEYITGDTNPTQSLYISKKDSISYAKLIYTNKGVDSPGEVLGDIVTQYLAAGTNIKTMPDIVHVNYLSTVSQVWMTEARSEDPASQTLWRVNKRYNVEYYVGGGTYHAYLTKKHVHKECGIDSTFPCDVHTDGAVHIYDYEFTQVGSSIDIITSASRSNAIGLNKDIILTQEAVDSLASRDSRLIDVEGHESDGILLCLNGYNLKFDKDVTFNMTKKLVISNCVNKGVVTVNGGETAKSLVNYNGSANKLSMYNLKFGGAAATKFTETNEPVVKVTSGDFVMENTTFTYISVAGENGILDYTGTNIYEKGLTFTNNAAISSPALIKLDISKYQANTFATISITNNTYKNKLVEVTGTGKMDKIRVYDNKMVAGGVGDTYGAIYIKEGANVTYQNKAQVEKIDTAVSPTSKGGAFSVYGTLTFNNDIDINDNKSSYGAGIYVGETGVVNINANANIKSNTAKVGIVYLEKAENLNVTGKLNLTSNTVSENGVIAFGRNYTMKNVVMKANNNVKSLIYNVNASGDALTIDNTNIISQNNNASMIGMKLKNVALNINGIEQTNIESNTMASLIDIFNGNVNINNTTIAVNNFNAPIIKLASLSSANIGTTGKVHVTTNGIKDAALYLKEVTAHVGADVIFGGNMNQRTAGEREVFISGDRAKVVADTKLATTSRLNFSSDTTGIVVFENWDAAHIEYYNIPQRNGNRFAYTPQNSYELAPTSDAKKQNMELYKDRDGKVYIGKEYNATTHQGDFVKATFKDIENNVNYVTQNLKLNEQNIPFDKVDVFECNLQYQNWSDKVEAATYDFNAGVQRKSEATISFIADYNRPHLHKECGCDSDATCIHEDATLTTHIERNYKPVANAGEIESTTYEYVYLQNDVVVTDTINVSSVVKGICLNGHTVTLSTDSNIFNLANDIDICNCGNVKGKLYKDEVSVGGFKSTSPMMLTNEAIKSNNKNIYVYDILFDSFKYDGGGVSDKSLVNAGTGKVYVEDTLVKNYVNRNLVGKNVFNTSGTLYIASTSFIACENLYQEITNNTHLNYVNVKNSVYDENLQGSIIANFKVTGSDVTFKNISFTGNKSMYPLVEVSASAVLTLQDNVRFENNEVQSVINAYGKLLNQSENITFKGNKFRDALINGYEDGSIITLNNLTFDGNSYIGDSNIMIEAMIRTKGELTMNNMTIKNQVADKIPFIRAERPASGAAKVIFNESTFTGNRFDSVFDLDEVLDADSKITNLTLSNGNNTFGKFMFATGSTMILDNISIDKEKFTKAAFDVVNTNLTIRNKFNVVNNTVSGEGTMLLTNTRPKVSGVINVSGNGKNIIVKDSNSYIKATGMIASTSVMSFAVAESGLKVYEGWNETYIENWGKTCETVNPKVYSVNPENTKLFAKDQSANAYSYYKQGVGNVEVRLGDTSKFNVYSFYHKYKDDNNVEHEELVNTQNVAKSIETRIDPVDSLEYELKNQTWLAPDNTGANTIKWVFTNGTIFSNIRASYNEAKKITYKLKHIHKECGLKYHDTCEHTDNFANHTETYEYVEVATTDTAYWVTDDGSVAQYIALQTDMTINDTMTVTLNALSNLKGICLNGYKIIFNANTLGRGFITNIANSLSIGDCHKDNRGSIKLQGTIKNANMFNVANGKKLSVYNITFEDIKIGYQDDGFGGTRTYYYFANVVSGGNAYFEKPIFVDNEGTFTAADERGFFNDANGAAAATKLHLYSPAFMNLTIRGNSLIYLTNNLVIDNIIMEGNNAQANPKAFIQVAPETANIKNISVKNNTLGGANGIINVPSGGTLNINSDAVLEGNKLGTGIVYVEGTLRLKGVLTIKDSQGSGIYLKGDNAKVESALNNVAEYGTIRFIGNDVTAGNGSAIYGERIKDTALAGLRNPYFENNKAREPESAVVFWSGDLVLNGPIFKDHKLYNNSTLEGHNGSLIRNNNNLNPSTGAGYGMDSIKITSPSFIGNTTNKNAIYLKEIKDGSVLDLQSLNTDNRYDGNTLLNAVYVDGGSVLIKGNVEKSTTKFNDSFIKVHNAEKVIMEGLNIKNIKTTNGAVNVEGAPIYVKGANKICDNLAESGDAKDIYLADENSYLKATGSYLDRNNSTYKISAYANNAKIFDGWNSTFIEYYDNINRNLKPRRYMLTPESTGMFVPGVAEAKGHYDVYKKGIDNDTSSVYLGSDFIKVTFANDMEYNPPRIYGTQNVAKGVETKLDHVDSFEYEIWKQEWWSPDDYQPPEKTLRDPAHTIMFAEVTGAHEKVKVNVNYNVDTTLYYFQKHIHKVCGFDLDHDCDHLSMVVHSNTEQYDFDPIQTIEQLEQAEDYVMLVNDLNIPVEMGLHERPIVLKPELKGLCLNGYSITGSAPEGKGLFDLSHDIVICNCRDEGSLKTDPTMPVQNNIINVRGSGTMVELFNIDFKGAPSGFKPIGKIANLQTGAELYIENMHITGINQTERNHGSSDGLFNGDVFVASLTIEGLNFTYPNPIIKIKGETGTISIINNKAVDKLGIISGDTQAKSFEFTNNTLTNGSILEVPSGVTLDTKQMIMTGNKSVNGGAIKVLGNLNIGEKAEFTNNTATNNGGAIYLDGVNAKLSSNEGSSVLFTGNTAVNGSAIYGNNISENALSNLKGAVYKAEKPTGKGIIAWTGDLKLRKALFEKNVNGTSMIENVGASDKADISDIVFKDNTTKKDGIILHNVQNNSIISSVSSVYQDAKNTFDNFIKVDGGVVKISDINNFKNNTITNAIINVNNGAETTIQDATITENLMSKYGVVVVDGATSKVKLQNVDINKNTNTGNFGTGLSAINNGNLIIVDNVNVSTNSSATGGAVYLDGPLTLQGKLNVTENKTGVANQYAKNIYLATNKGRVVADGTLNTDSRLSFTGAQDNMVAFEGWDATHIANYDNPPTNGAYTPESTGVFLVDEGPSREKKTIYKAGTDGLLKLGSNKYQIIFASVNADGSKNIYSLQNVEKGASVRLDKVDTSLDPWVAPNVTNADASEWRFANGPIRANFTDRQYVYQPFNYYIKYTAGSRAAKVEQLPSFSYEYGKNLTIFGNLYTDFNDFDHWALETEVNGVPTTLHEGDIVKNLCNIPNGTAVLRAIWKDEVVIRFNPNGEYINEDISISDSYNIYAKKTDTITIPATYDQNRPPYTKYDYNLKKDGTGTAYPIGSKVKFNQDTTLYCIWKRPDEKPAPVPPGPTPTPTPHHGGGGGGGGGGGIISNGTIIDGIFIPNGMMEFGPGFIQVFTVDEYGNIKDPAGNIVGNIYLGDRVNADGSFTAANGITKFADGRVMDVNGNIYNLDGSITLADGMTVYANGDVKDTLGNIYHKDGTVTFFDGSFKDKDGYTHFMDGSLLTPDGIRFFVDGSILFFDGTLVLKDGTVIPPGQPIPETAKDGTPGAWEFSPTTGKWKFVNVMADGSKSEYKDKWILNKDANGNDKWFMVDHDGNMVIGWVKKDGEYFYMSNDRDKLGELMKGQVVVDGKTYKLDPVTGAYLGTELPAKDLTVIGATNHLSGKDGNWEIDENTHKRRFVVYFTIEDVTIPVPPNGWFMVDGQYYYFDENGVPMVGLVVYDNKYYYFRDDGTMMEGGDITIGDTKYEFDKATGACKQMTKVD